MLNPDVLSSTLTNRQISCFESWGWSQAVRAKSDKCQDDDSEADSLLRCNAVNSGLKERCFNLESSVERRRLWCVVVRCPQSGSSDHVKIPCCVLREGKFSQRRLPGCRTARRHNQNVRSRKSCRFLQCRFQALMFEGEIDQTERNNAQSSGLPRFDTFSFSLKKRGLNKKGRLKRFWHARVRCPQGGGDDHFCFPSRRVSGAANSLDAAR
jgi:hypothetical protein